MYFFRRYKREDSWLHPKGVGFVLRLGSHAWHLRSNPMKPVFSERNKINCNWWQIANWRLTHRWNLRK